MLKPVAWHDPCGLPSSVWRHPRDTAELGGPYRGFLSVACPGILEA
jgi:hypothetical protein